MPLLGAVYLYDRDVDERGHSPFKTPRRRRGLPTSGCVYLRVNSGGGVGDAMTMVTSTQSRQGDIDEETVPSNIDVATQTFCVIHRSLTIEPGADAVLFLR